MIADRDFSLYWTLGPDHELIPTRDLMVWGRFFEQTEKRRVGRDQVGPWDISTVFLGMDHGYGNGPPVLFETMVFGPDPFDNETERYCTWDEAIAGHVAMVERVRSENAMFSKGEKE